MQTGKLKLIITWTWWFSISWHDAEPRLGCGERSKKRIVKPVVCVFRGHFPNRERRVTHAKDLVMLQVSAAPCSPATHPTVQTPSLYLHKVFTNKFSSIKGYSLSWLVRDAFGGVFVATRFEIGRQPAATISTECTLCPSPYAKRTQIGGMKHDE